MNMHVPPPGMNASHSEHFLTTIFLISGCTNDPRRFSVERRRRKKTGAGDSLFARLNNTLLCILAFICKMWATQCWRISPKWRFLLNFIGATVLGKIYIPHNYTEIGQYILEKVVFICRHQADRHSHDMSQALTRVSHPNLVTHWIRDPWSVDPL